MIPAINPSLVTLNPTEWSVGPINADPASNAAGNGANFADALSSALNSLQQSQNTAASASQALATGQASDPTQAISAVENASLQLDLASQVRTKLTEGLNTIFQSQV